MAEKEAQLRVTLYIRFNDSEETYEGAIERLVNNSPEGLVYVQPDTIKVEDIHDIE